jgi:hypothetical protein
MPILGRAPEKINVLGLIQEFDDVGSAIHQNGDPEQFVLQKDGS